jgi:hypothetical protein
MKILAFTAFLFLYFLSQSIAYEEEVMAEIKANGDTHIQVKERDIDRLPEVVALHNPLEPLD